VPPGRDRSRQRKSFSFCYLASRGQLIFSELKGDGEIGPPQQRAGASALCF